MTDILHALNNKGMVGGVFIDLGKAFDTIDHVILTKKLTQYGLTGNGLKRMTSYLKAGITDYNLITHGIPQGSCLGPLLFTMYKRHNCSH